MTPVLRYFKNSYRKKNKHRYSVWTGIPPSSTIYYNQIKSNHFKSLLLSHHHSTSALVSEILMSVLQTVQKNNRQFTYGQTVQKKQQQFTYGQTVQKTALEHLQCSRQCKKKKKQQQLFTYGQTVQKKQQQQFTYGQTVQKKQQQFTYGQYIFTDCTEDNVQNTHTCTQYA